MSKNPCIGTSGSIPVIFNNIVTVLDLGRWTWGPEPVTFRTYETCKCGFHYHWSYEKEVKCLRRHAFIGNMVPFFLFGKSSFLRCSFVLKLACYEDSAWKLNFITHSLFSAGLFWRTAGNQVTRIKPRGLEHFDKCLVRSLDTKRMPGYFMLKFIVLTAVSTWSLFPISGLGLGEVFALNSNSWSIFTHALLSSAKRRQI